MAILEIPEGYIDMIPTEEQEQRFIDLVHEHALACGGNWSAMLLSVIKGGLPELWETMPERSYQFTELVLLIYLNLDQIHKNKATH